MLTMRRIPAIAKQNRATEVSPNSKERIAIKANVAIVSREASKLS